MQLSNVPSWAWVKAQVKSCEVFWYFGRWRRERKAAAQILEHFFIHEMQDSILLIPKIISNISNNYSSSESFVSLWNESLANKQIWHFPTSFNCGDTGEVAAGAEKPLWDQWYSIRAVWGKSKLNPAPTWNGCSHVHSPSSLRALTPSLELSSLSPHLSQETSPMSKPCSSSPLLLHSPKL